jgi:imidazolonepropionase-like amidohydrolase
MTIRRATEPLRAAIAALALAAVVGACGDDGPAPIALVGATVIDGGGGEPLRDATIIVRDGRIEAIGPRGDVDVPRGADEIDVSGRFIIPGLIDAHGHTARWTLLRYLAYGVTSVRDVHGTSDSVHALRDGALLGTYRSPRIYIAGAMLDAAPTTYDDALPVGTPADARRAVDQLTVSGVDFVKGYTRLTPPMIEAAIAEARTFHLPVTVHLGLTDAVTASGLGVTSIEHLSGVPEAAMLDPEPLYRAHRAGFFAGWTSFERSWVDLDSVAMLNVARTLAERKVVLIPTLVLHEFFSRPYDPDVARNPDLTAVPAVEQARWNVPGMIARAGWTQDDFAAFRRARPRQDLFLRLFRSAGGTIAAGTDASNQLLVPGGSLHTELELLVRAGLPPEEALLSATGHAARLLGADSLGHLATGKVADLVILRGNPLQSISNTRAIDRVMVRGVLLSPDSVRSGW